MAPGKAPLCYVFQNTNTVFVGEVLKVETKKLVPTDPALRPELKQDDTFVYQEVTLAVTENFKNAAAPSIQVMTLAAAYSSCDTVYDLKVGEKWVVFADPKDFVSGELVSSFAIKLNENKEDETLAGLSKIKEHGIEASLFGHFNINYPLSQINIKGKRVTAEADGHRFTAKLDEYGGFAFPKVPAGTYSVRIYLPYQGYVLDDKRNRREFSFDNDSGLYVYEFAVVVKDGECSYQRIGAFPPDSKEQSN